MKFVYLVAAIIGAIVPYVYFIDHFQLHGMGLGAFIAEATITPAAQGVTADASIASFVFWAFMVQRPRFSICRPPFWHSAPCHVCGFVTAA